MMNQLLTIAAREIKMGFRNPWAYSLMGLFSLFMLILWLINVQGYVQGYSGATSTMLNLILYFLPLTALMLGSFSLTGEREDGSWELLTTFPIHLLLFLLGKFLGLTVVLLCIILIGFGAVFVVGSFAGSGFDFLSFVQLLVFSVSLVSMFLAISFAVGAAAKNRWQAMTISVAIWFLMIMAWPALLIAFLGFMPYSWIEPTISLLTLLNPAELSRLFIVIKLGGGSVFGPEYYEWVQWVRNPSGTVSFIGITLLWIILTLSLSNVLWKRGQSRV